MTITNLRVAWAALVGAAAALALGCADEPTGELAADEELAAVAQSLPTESLEQYAAKCDQAIGVTVPDFDCDSGTLVPTTNHRNGKCDQPNRLHNKCDPGSKFQVLTRTDDAYVVAHCRKQDKGTGKFGDIAVIQYNRKNGSTCFYQALGTLPGKVKAPSKGTGAWPWMTPAATAGEDCVGCHDNGPLVRSPYLTQVKDHNKLPGAGDPMFNRDQPYRFVGNDFASWKVFKVEVAGNLCNGCHRMGTHNLPADIGSSLHLGPVSTAPDGAKANKQKNPHGPQSPIWMTPGAVFHNPEAAKAAEEIRACASRRFENPLPSAPDCRITEYSGTSAPTVPGAFAAVWTPSSEPEIQVYGWPVDDVRAKYDELWTDGWRLHILQPYVLADGSVRYNAAWRQTWEPEIQVYGWREADLRALYDQLWADGWRLKVLQPHVVNGETLFSAVWTQTWDGEIQVFGWREADVRSTYDELWGQGWRLKILQPYVVNGEVLYAAVWAPSWDGEIQVFSWAEADLRSLYDSLWNQGWRLKTLVPAVLNGQVLYTATWRPSWDGEIQVFGWSYPDFRATYDQLWEQGWRLSQLSAF